MQTFGTDDFYIGFNDIASEGQWVWASGDPVTYTNWGTGEPNNGSNDEDCGLVSLALSGRWNDAPSHGHAVAVLEVQGGPTMPVMYSAAQTNGATPTATHHALAPLPTGGAVLFGGTTGTGPQPFTYELQNGSWAKRFSFNNPMTRSEHSLLLDPVSGNNVLFGGRNPLGIALGDTWTYLNGQWTPLSLATAPAPRSEHRMAFDSTSHTGLLFGGKGTNGTALGDFWSWNGTSWTQLNPTTLPPARFAHGLAFDTYRSRTVLYGGADATGRLDDVWEWTGTDWAQVTPAPGPNGPWSPGPRQSSGMAYDPRSERVVVHGGETANGCMADAWSWNGTSWTLHTTTGSAPSNRSGEQLLFDPNGNQLLLFAGGCGLNLTNDLWVLELPVFSRSNTYGIGCGNGIQQPLSLNARPGSSAIVGQTLQMDLGNMPPAFFPPFGMLSFNRTTWNGMPLPLDLTFLGLPGCVGLSSSDQTYLLALPNAQGVSAWSLALPNTNLLLGVELNFQGINFVGSGPTGWATFSNGLTVRCGDR